MPKKSQHYLLTHTAAEDFREARQWSLSRWGKQLIKQYFFDLHQSAEYIALNHQFIAEKNYLVSTTGLGVHAVREHYLVYFPIEDKKIVIIALLRQTRDVPAILKANSYVIHRELKEIISETHKHNNTP